MKKIYCYHIRDGENTYFEYYSEKMNAEEVCDGFMRICKDIDTLEMTDKEFETFKKFNVI